MRVPGLKILWRLILTLPVLLLVNGCATQCRQNYALPFDFQRDTFAYRNDLKWEYLFDDATGKTSHRRREPEPDYTHHCFVVARSARQFFQHATFDAGRPAVDEADYRKLIHQVVGRDPMRCTADEERVVIPGFANLREFSLAREQLLKEECGGAWRSYLQRGHWRMVLPFTRGHQEREAARLAESIRENRPPIVHIVSFPQLAINHALVLFAVEEVADELHFAAYDPYDPSRPVPLTFDRSARKFLFDRNAYFTGGKVNIYEIYRAWNY